MNNKANRLDSTKQAASEISGAQIEGLAKLDATQAATALKALFRNPHVAMIAGAQTNYCMRGTREPLSDALWKKIKEDMKGAWAEDWWNTSSNEAIEQLKDEHGICDVGDCDDAGDCA